jgi:cell division protein FtsI (penicillin-binding protein 3)
LTLYNAVANNGKMVKPMIVQAIARGNQVEKQYQTEVIRKNIASEKTILQLQELLEGVVKNGTAKNVYNEQYRIAGKTGTAQKLEDGRYTKKYYTSFVGYFPADNPKYSAIVVIDSPKGFNAFGGDISAPVFKEIADKIHAQDLNMNRKYPADIYMAQQESDFPFIQAGKFDELQLICNRFGISNHGNGVNDGYVKSRAMDKSIQFQANQVEAPVMPDVSGLALRDALYVLENKGLRVIYQGKGRVKNQSISPGSPIQQNNVINLILG